MRVHVHTGTPYETLYSRWPWRRVKEANEAITQKQFEAAYPTTQLLRAYLQVNSRHGTAPTMQDLLLPSVNPFPEHAEEDIIYSEAIIEAFQVAFDRRLTGNGILAVMGTRQLRASGWTNQRRTLDG